MKQKNYKAFVICFAVFFLKSVSFADLIDVTAFSYSSQIHIFGGDARCYVYFANSTSDPVVLEAPWPVSQWAKPKCTIDLFSMYLETGECNTADMAISDAVWEFVTLAEPLQITFSAIADASPNPDGYELFIDFELKNKTTGVTLWNKKWWNSVPQFPVHIEESFMLSSMQEYSLSLHTECLRIFEFGEGQYQDLNFSFSTISDVPEIETVFVIVFSLIFLLLIAANKKERYLSIHFKH